MNLYGTVCEYCVSLQPLSINNVGRQSINKYTAKMKEKQKSKTIVKVALLVLFSAFVLRVFGLYSILRPAAYGAYYKEYLSAVFVILTCFLNYFVLFPFLYKKRKFLLYALLTFISILITVTAEEILVYPQVSETIRQIGALTMREFSFLITSSLFVRDTCFIGFFFLISLLEDALRENREINDSLKKINSLIIAKRNNSKGDKNETITIPIKDIVYSQQKENYTYLFTTDGNNYNRNGSLSGFAKQLGEKLVVRISRSVLVFYNHIHSFDDNTVYVEFPNNEGMVGLEISDAYKDRAMKLLNKHISIPSFTNEKTGESEANKMPSTESSETLDENVFSTPTKEKANIQLFLDYIQAHPGCKGSEIEVHFRVSLSTVNRILRQLREEGLIEYTGSKKTGGYRVVEERP